MTASILEYTKSNMLFLIGLLLGGFVVYRYLREKFDQPTLPRDDGDLVSIIAPRFLATHTQYANALLLYIGLAEMVFISLSFLGPSAFPGVQQTPSMSESFPIWVALVLTGV